VLVLVLVLALASSARADSPSSDADILGRDPGWTIEDVRLRTSYLDQRGHGYQAQGGQPGSEAMWILEPWALITVRQNARVAHEVMVPIDAITAASPDSVDATTQASRRNVSEDLDVRSTFKRSDHDTLTTRVALHHEEPLSSATLGAGWKRGLADDNATIAINGAVTVDGFDGRDHTGTYLGKTARETVNANVAASQLLSPTTVIDGGYGVTLQHGTLSTGWNAVPLDTGELADERLPRTRLRHALSVRLAQHVPVTHSTIKAWYRVYLDDFGLRAHTVEISGYQYVVPWLWARASYRYHHQTGAEFFTTELATPFMTAGPRTADSDLAPLSANEWTIGLATVAGRGPGELRPWAFAAELLRYTRSNDLQITTISLSIGRVL
jgi:hypothetical protein